LAGTTIVAIFAAIVVLQNLPSWTGEPESVVRTPLEQRWNLFAPDPPSANLHTFLLVRSVDGSVSAPIALSAAVRENARSQRLFAPKLVRVVTKLNVALEEHVDHPSPKLLEEYRRMLSGAALGLPGPRIASVRGVLERTPVGDSESRELLFDSGWMPFARDVEPMGVL
jgi:hypothetical protein